MTILKKIACTALAAALVLAGCENPADNTPAPKSDNTVPVTAVMLGTDSLTLETAATGTLTASILPARATDKTVAWSSSNPAVAAVNSDGLIAAITGVAAGTAEITVTSANGKTAAATVMVTVPGDNAVPVTAVTLNTDSLTLGTGAAGTLTATVLPADATNKTVTWSSSNPAVAAVNSDGLTAAITGVAAGIAEITVTSANGKTAAATVTVNAPVGGEIPITAVTLNIDGLTLETGAAGTLTATVLPADATDKTVTWSSSNPAVAAVNADGLTAAITGVAAGTAEITVTSANGKTATATVTVNAPADGTGQQPSYRLKVRNLKSGTLAAGTTPDNPAIISWDGETWTGTLNIANAEASAVVGTSLTIALTDCTLVYLGTPLDPPFAVQVTASITGGDSSGNTGFWAGAFANPIAAAYNDFVGTRHTSNGVLRQYYTRSGDITAQQFSGNPTAVTGTAYTYRITWDGAAYTTAVTVNGTEYSRTPSDLAATVKTAETGYPGFLVYRQNVTITEIHVVHNAGPKELYIAPNGSDSNSGTIGSPLATLAKAQQLAGPGYTVYIRGGTYVMTEDQIAAYWNNNVYACVFNMNKSGTGPEETRRIRYWAYPGDSRPVFDLSQVQPAGKRVIAFHITGSYLHFKGFDVTGVQVTETDHTQSECFRIGGNTNAAANENIFENLAMHNGMGIGLYLHRGSNNLVLNCDAYENWDSVSEGGSGGNTDGFGGHPEPGSTGNVFRGCRAWYNSDDGFDLIRAYEAVTIENCWAAYNGYSWTDGQRVSRADGTGIKAGGWGMDASQTITVSPVPRHTVRFSLAAYNKNNGIYANHQLGGGDWYNNTAYRNNTNFNMVNRKSIDEVVDVPGYGHVLKNNLSYSPRSGTHLSNLDTASSTADNNSFTLGLSLSDSDFESLEVEQMLGPRKADGSLPDITFMKPKAGSLPIDKGVDIGFSYNGSAPDLGYVER